MLNLSMAELLIMTAEQREALAGFILTFSQGRKDHFRHRYRTRRSRK